MLPHLRGNELDDIAFEAAGDALVAVLARLDDFRGASRFTTWVYKFALLEAAAKLRKRAWQGRELPVEADGWAILASTGLGPDEEAAQSELVAVLRRAIPAAIDAITAIDQPRAARRARSARLHLVAAEAE